MNLLQVKKRGGDVVFAEIAANFIEELLLKKPEMITMLQQHAQELFDADVF